MTQATQVARNSPAQVLDNGERTRKALAMFDRLPQGIRGTLAASYLEARLGGAQLPDEVLNHRDFRFAPVGLWITTEPALLCPRC
jgi:hypothetical protein